MSTLCGLRMQTRTKDKSVQARTSPIGEHVDWRTMFAFVYNSHAVANRADLSEASIHRSNSYQVISSDFRTAVEVILFLPYLLHSDHRHTQLLLSFSFQFSIKPNWRDATNVALSTCTLFCQFAFIRFFIVSLLLILLLFSIMSLSW